MFHPATVVPMIDRTASMLSDSISSSQGSNDSAIRHFTFVPHQKTDESPKPETILSLNQIIQGTLFSSWRPSSPREMPWNSVLRV